LYIEVLMINIQMYM